jgi:2-polyprenyl-6-methoxyphenol hydroxylase-like FAD-dependent oxidoreductase
METTHKTEVLIVGAGPTGLSLACQFIRYGVDFVIVDKKDGVTAFSKALGVHARTLEIYEQLGLAQGAVEQGTPASKVRLFEHGQALNEFDLSHIGTGLTTYPYMLVLEQSQNERLLYDYLQTHGQAVRWQTALESFEQNETGVTARIKTATGETQTIEAAYLVGCDGPRSPVRHALGLSFEGSTFERLFYVADVEIDWQHPHDALQLCLTDKAIVAFFPMKGDKRYRIVGSFPEGFAKEPDEISYEEIEQRIRDESEIELEISNVRWFSVYRVHTRHVEKFSQGRCFLAGDAGHVHTPAGGQGMNTGIQDAYNLAWKMALVLRGAADERILETYNEERLENAKNLLATTDRMFNVLAGTDWFLNLIRTTIFPPLAKYVMSLDVVRKKFFPLVSQIGINYRHASLSQHAGDEAFTVKAGDRLPYFLADGASIFDQLREPKFHLLAFSDGTDNYAALRDEIAGAFAGLVNFRVVPLYPRVAELFGAQKPFAVLLRPDNYIGFISEENAAKELRAYLNALK